MVAHRSRRLAGGRRQRRRRNLGVSARRRIHGGQRLDPGDPSWDDFDVEARVNVNAFAESSATSLGGICARVGVPGDYYLLALRADGYVDLRRVSSYAETILTTTSAPVIAANTWYTVRLSAVGSNLNAYLNGVLLLTAADATYPSGEIGLQTDGATAQFDDVTVTTP